MNAPAIYTPPITVLCRNSPWPPTEWMLGNWRTDTDGHFYTVAFGVEGGTLRHWTLAADTREDAVRVATGLAVATYDDCLVSREPVEIVEHPRTA